MSTRADFKAARNGCGCAGVTWLVGLSIVELPFEALYPRAGAVGGVIVAVVGVVVGIVWTLVAIKMMAKYGSASFHEKQRWARQEAARLRKQAWKEGRSAPVTPRAQRSAVRAVRTPSRPAPPPPLPPPTPAPTLTQLPPSSPSTSTILPPTSPPSRIVPPTSPPPSRQSTIVPPTSMNADVPKDLADLRSRFQAELEATRALPSAISRRHAELDVRKRLNEALDKGINTWMAGASPEQRARYQRVIEAQQAGAQIEFDKDGHTLGWWEGSTFHPLESG